MGWASFADCLCRKIACLWSRGSGSNRRNACNKAFFTLNIVCTVHATNGCAPPPPPQRLKPSWLCPPPPIVVPHSRLWPPPSQSAISERMLNFKLGFGNSKRNSISGKVWFSWGLTPQQQPGSYQGGEMMMKSVLWWRKPEYPEETTDLRQVTDETFHTYGLCPVRGLNLGRSGVKHVGTWQNTHTFYICGTWAGMEWVTP